MKTYRFAIIYSIVSILIAGLLGYHKTAELMGLVTGILIACSLGVTETSMSMDNSIVNAPLVRDLTPFWKKNYLLFGMPVAVIGMRFCIPVLFVGVASGLGFYGALHLAFTDPTAYSEHLSNSKFLIVGFGSTFLALLGSDFFFDAEKEVHWIFLERIFSKLGNIPGFKYFVAGLIALVGGFLISNDIGMYLKYEIAAVIGMMSFIFIKAIGHFAEKLNRPGIGGLIKFIQIEVIDASFSFDGVISAFAITNDIIQIAIGLGIGAVWVRTFTKMMSESKSFAELPYIGSGAFWNITALVPLMIIGVRFDIPEWVPGLVAVLIIGKSFYDSKKAI